MAELLQVDLITLSLEDLATTAASRLVLATASGSRMHLCTVTSMRLSTTTEVMMVCSLGTMWRPFLRDHLFTMFRAAAAAAAAAAGATRLH